MNIELSKSTDSFDTRFNRWAEKSTFWNSLSDTDQQQLYQEMKASIDNDTLPGGSYYNHTSSSSEAQPNSTNVYNHILSVYCILSGVIFVVCTVTEPSIALHPIGIMLVMGLVMCLVPVLKNSFEEK